MGDAAAERRASGSTIMAQWPSSLSALVIAASVGSSGSGHISWFFTRRDCTGARTGGQPPSPSQWNSPVQRRQIELAGIQMSAAAFALISRPHSILEMFSSSLAAMVGSSAISLCSVPSESDMIRTPSVAAKTSD